MGKIVQNGVNYGGVVNQASQVMSKNGKSVDAELDGIKTSLNDVQNLSFNPETANVTLTSGGNIAKKWGHIVFINFDFTPKANFTKLTTFLSILGVTASMMSHCLIKTYATDEFVGTGLLYVNPNLNDRIMLRTEVALSANVRYRGSAILLVD